MVSATQYTARGQGWQYSEQFGTDVWTGNTDYDMKIIDCNKGSGNAIDIYKCLLEDSQTSFANPTFVKGMGPNTSGLYGKVAAAVEAQRPKKSSGSKKGVAGTSYNYQTSDKHLQWAAEKRAKDAAAREAAEENKRLKKLQQKIADDNRAAAVTAQTNAMLQHQTNRRIQNDRYNANEGAYLAQQRARNAHHIVGPQFDKNNPKATGAQKAQMLKGQNKPRRIMYPQHQARNTARKPLPQVKRTAVDPERAAMIQRALAVKAELQRQKALKAKQEQKNKPKMVYHNGKYLVVLDEHAHSTLGREWNTESLTTPPPPPINKPKMTTDERIDVFMYEFFGAKESNLTAKEFEELLATKEL